MMQKSTNTRSFKALMVTQFLGAFNDNVYKIIISLLAIKLLPSAQAQTKFVSLIGALFIIPFILLSPYAGYLADKYRKRSIIVGTKILELIIMILGLFALASGSIPFICFTLFLMATQSAFFGPAKYGIMPELLDERDLSRGNGYLSMWTFLAIILGTALGGKLVSMMGDHIEMSSLILIALSCVGLVASLFIRKGDAPTKSEPFELNIFKSIFVHLRAIKQNSALFLTMIALAYFWFLGAVAQMNVLLYGKNILHLGDTQTSLLIVATAVGIGVGSVLAGRLSEGKIEFGLVPLGSLGITVCAILLGVGHVGHLGALFQLFLLGLFSGFYVVPLSSFFQQNSPQDCRGKFIAVLNICNAFMMLLGAAFVWFCGVQLKMNAAQIFLALGLASIIATVFVFKKLPDAFLRFFNWILTHSLYKVKVLGIENLPEKGGALIVCNHSSFADPSLIMASTKRHVRFLMFRPIYNNKFLHPLCKIMRAIPVSLKDSPKEIIRSLQTAKKAVEQGEVVCIFAEGALTRTGNMLNFNRGFETIMKGVDAPIIPVNIDSIWGSIFTYERGKYFWKMPKHTPNPVTVSFGRTLPSTAKAYQVRLAVQELGADAFSLRGKYQEKLHIAFIREAKKRPFKLCMADSTGLELKYYQALGMVMMLSHLCFSSRENKEKVGILLPSSVMASIVNGAALMAGKIAVNINFTASKESMAAAIEQCEIKTIITSKKFLAKLNIEAQSNMVFLEDLKPKITVMKKVFYMAAAFLLPKFLIKAAFARGGKGSIDDIATIIFSSGSTGEPKGVMLSHGNIFSNIQGFWQVANIQPNDVVMGVLPFFHSFGFTAGLCFPVGTGLSVVYHTNPLDASTIGKMVEKYKATIILGTPTFFSSYLRKCTKEQFASVRYAIAGAEKLQKKMVEGFVEKFGITPLEGYGATELSPIIALSVHNPDNEKESVKQYGYKLGKVGHPIPGVVAKVVDPETFELLTFDQPGLLLIKGPNVMKGYLKNPQKTAEVMKDGWYVTGDIAAIDTDGFIYITDRLSRFSKIAGEMVPHIKIEEEIEKVCESIEPMCAVTAVADEKKGERLIVLCVGVLDVDFIRSKLSEGNLPNLWIPKKECFISVDTIPLLGTGKKDLAKIKNIAKEHFSNES